MLTAFAAPRASAQQASWASYASAAAPAARATVAFFRINGETGPLDHDASSKSRVAESLANLLGHDFVCEPDLAASSSAPRYLVPTDTITTLEQARRLGIRSAQDLFGGVVPHPFVASKVISHPLVHAGAQSLPGWSTAYGERVQDAVLPGWSVFCPEDARQAAEWLFRGGGVRAKDPAGVGGVGQWVVKSVAELDELLAELGSERLAQHGLVLERNLNEVATHSVGQVQVGAHIASYFGTQGLTRNGRGDEVYGGSDLVVCRGGFEELLRQPLPPTVRRAVEQSLVFHRAALECFPDMMASRCNYDVASGVDDDGRALSGVLEQSWRVGGASGAEAAALHAFKADPELQRVRACTCELYGDDAKLPPGAWLLYDGPDRQGTRLLKYAQVSLDVDA